MPLRARVYILLVSIAGVTGLGYALLTPPWTRDVLRFWTYFPLSLIAATLKLRLPGLTQTMSIGFVFVLLGIAELTLPETMLLAVAGVVVQCLWQAKVRPKFVQVLFSASAVAACLVPAYSSAHVLHARWHSGSLPLAAATGIYFLGNSLLVSGVLSLVQRQPFVAVWQRCYPYAFPYYLLGGAVVELMDASGRDLGWRPPLVLLSVMGLAYLFYRMYLARFAGQAAKAPGI